MAFCDRVNLHSRLMRSLKLKKEVHEVLRLCLRSLQSITLVTNLNSVEEAWDDGEVAASR